MTRTSEPRYPNAYSWSLVTLFILISFFGSLFFAYLLFRFSTQIYQIAEMYTYRDSGALLADRLSSGLRSGSFEPSEKERVSKTIAAYHPGLLVYVLDSRGNVLTQLGVPEAFPRKSFQVEPLERFIESGHGSLSAGLQNHPLSNQEKLFLAFPLQIAEEKGYLYLEPWGSRAAEAALRSAWVSRRLWTNAALPILLVLSAISIVTFLLLRRTREFHRISKVVRDLADGRLSERASYSGDDELGEFARTVNEMAETIEGNIRDLKEQDIKRQEMIANLSHDLRAPATHLRLRAEAFEEEAPEVRESILLLEEVLHDLFDLATLAESGKELQIVEFSLEAVLDDLLMQYHAYSKRRNLSFEIRIAENLPPPRMKVEHFTRVLNNILRAVTRIAVQNSMIRITASCDESESGEAGIQMNVLAKSQAAKSQVAEEQVTEESEFGNQQIPKLGILVARQILRNYSGVLQSGVTDRGDIHLKLYVPETLSVRMEHVSSA